VIDYPLTGVIIDGALSGLMGIVGLLSMRRTLSERRLAGLVSALIPFWVPCRSPFISARTKSRAYQQDTIDGISGHRHAID